MACRDCRRRSSCVRRSRWPPERSEGKVMVTVLYFAACRERTGVSSERIDDVSATATVDDVVAAVKLRHPALSDVLPRCRIAVNQAFARNSDLVPANAEVALIPPVAGG